MVVRIVRRSVFARWGGFVGSLMVVDSSVSFPATDPEDRLLVWGIVLLFMVPPVGIVLLLIWRQREEQG